MQQLSGVEPFVEVKNKLDLVPSRPQLLLYRHMYSPECEATMKEHTNLEYNLSYVYHDLYTYFDHDNDGLSSLSQRPCQFFKEMSVKERDHEYQNKRGGKIKLEPKVMPQSEFDYTDKEDALYAMELALSLEKLVNENLLNVSS